MNPLLKRLQREALVIRVLWLLLFFVVWQVVAPLLLLVVLAQLLVRLFRREPHSGLMCLGTSLGLYLAQIARFASFQSDDTPWPVADWPQEPVADVGGEPL